MMKREKDTQQKVKTHISTFWRVGPTKLRYGSHGVERWGVFEKRKGIKKTDPTEVGSAVCFFRFILQQNLIIQDLNNSRLSFLAGNNL